MPRTEPSSSPKAPEMTPEERERDRVLLVAGLLSMWGPVAAGYAAYVGRSMVLVADMLRSATDSVGLVMSWWAYRVSRRYAGPDQAQHVARLDRQSGLLLAAVMGISAVTIGAGAVREFANPQPVGRILVGVLVAIGGVAYNAWFWRRYLGIAHQTGSAMFHAQWRLYRAKAAANVTVLVTLVSGSLLKAKAWSASVDAVGSLVVAGFLVASGIATVRKALQQPGEPGKGHSQEPD